MFKEPYSQCVFTIKNVNDLNQRFEDGGDGTFEEGRRWIEGQQLKVKADREGRPLLVLFADAGAVGRVLYYAVLEKIEVPLQGNRTTYTFTNLLPVAWPFLHKTDLVMTDGRNVSAGQIKPYTICRTPPPLLMSEEELFASMSTTEENDSEEIEEADGSEETESLDPRVLHSGNTRFECYELLQDLASAIPKRDDQKLANLRNIQTGEPAWDDVALMLFQVALEEQYNLKIKESEIAGCVTVGELAALMKSKIK